MVKPAERNTRYVDAVMTIPKVRSAGGTCPVGVPCPPVGWKCTTTTLRGWDGDVNAACTGRARQAGRAAAHGAARPAGRRTAVIHNLLPAVLLQGTLFPMCGMNLAFDREAIGPAMYFGLMGEGQPWGRYDGERGVGAAKGMVCAECALLPFWCRVLCHKHASKHKLAIACWLPPNQHSMLPLVASAADMWAGWCVKKVRAAADHA